MKALLLDVQRDTIEYVEPQGLADFYRLIDCDLIDITCREINGKRYDIICDDCGWFSLVPDHALILCYARHSLYICCRHALF